MRTRPLLLTLLAAAATVTLAGCSGSSPASELSYEDSPMSAFFGGNDEEYDEDAAQAESMEQQRKIEELVAECMQAEGFEYTPQKIDESMWDTGVEWKPDDREWVAQYGYGITVYPGRDDEPDDTEPVVDPNQAYVEMLSESEQAAYYEALQGPPMDYVEGEEYEYDWTTSGCYGSAQNEIYPETPEQDLSQFDDLMTAMSEMYDGLYSDESPSEPDAAWATCMTSAGYSEFERQVDAQTSISDRASAMYDEAYGSGDDVENVEDPMTTPEGKALTEEEIELALADLDCREKTDYADAQLRLQFAAEEAFIAEHRAELEAYKAAIDAGA